jgi:hypothetical protein
MWDILSCYCTCVIAQTWLAASLCKLQMLEYPTNKTLNTANKILMKKKNKSNFLEKNLCYEKLPKFEQHFELVLLLDEKTVLLFLYVEFGLGGCFPYN